MRFRRHREAADSATLGLLAGFAVTLALLVLAVNAGLALAWRLTLAGADYPRLFFETNTALVLLFVLGGTWVETLRLREGGAHVARLAGARPAQPGGSGAAGGQAALERRFVNVLHEMALASRQPAPAAWVLPRDETINAFAAGWQAGDAVVAVTQGALQRLDRAELQGLVAHELGHLVSGDTRLNMRLIGFVWGLQLVHGFGRDMALPDDRGRLPATAIVGGVLMALGWLGWLGGRLLQAAVSRQREFHADAAAVQYSRTVAGIGGALRKAAGLPPQPRPHSPQALAHLWLVEPPRSARAWLRAWLGTHPPLSERLRRLYGRAVEDLPAPLLPPPLDEPMVELLVASAHGPTRAATPSFAPSSAMAGGTTIERAGSALAASASMSSADPVARQAPQAERAAQAAVEARSAQAARDALQRSQHWRSRGERHAALLAWLIVDEGARADWPAWRAAVAAAPWSEQIREDLLCLDARERLACVQRLVNDVLPAERAVLLQAVRPLSRQPGPRLRAAWIARATSRLARTPRPRRPATVALASLGPQRRAAAALLARVVAASPEPAPRWAVGSDPAVARPPSPWDAFGLRRLHPMHSPLLAREWVERHAARLPEPGAATHLALACELLATPYPPALERALNAARQPKDQERSL